jgi:threonine/homoserine efflux transporter RhtA
MASVAPVGWSRRPVVPPGWLVVISAALVQVGASVATGLFVAYGPIAGFLLLSQILGRAELVAIALVSAASVGASLTAKPEPATPGALGA